MLLIQMHRGTSLFSRLIRWFSRSEYSHVSLWVWDALEPHGGMVYEAVEGAGVRALPANHYWAARQNGHIVCYTLREPLTPAQLTTLVGWCESELGSGYDWLGVFRFISRRRQDGNRDKWFCSEFASEMLARVGVHLFNDRPHWQVMPGDIPHSLAVVRTDNPEARV